jgi:plasmid stability protein
VKVTIELPDDLYRALKIEAAAKGRKIKDVVAEALREKLAAPTDAAIESGRNVSESQTPYFAYKVSRALPHLSKEERKRRALSIIGKFSSGLPDIAQNHDDYLAEAYLS